MEQEVKLLSRPINFAVVQLPERSYPGVVVQGDTLHGVVRQLARMRELLAANELDELSEEIKDMREQLLEALAHYESICAERGIGLPYNRDPDVSD